MDSRTQENEELQCTMCSKKFNTLTKIKKHLKTHNLTCDKCTTSFKTYHQKRLHDRSYHPQKREKVCKICPEETFKTQEAYHIHVQDIHEGKLIDCYMCSVCGKTFKTGSKLKQHIESKCGTEKLFICKECGQKLMSQGSLYNHMRRHSDVANFICRFCTKLFHTAGQLKVHERIHTQQRDFICEVCGKGFCHRQSLITHSTIHTGIKPFQCEGCGKSFSCIGNLLKHRKSHSDSCGLLPLTSHRVQNPSTKLKVRINTPASTKLKEMERNKERQVNLDGVTTEDEKQVKSENSTNETLISTEVSADKNCERLNGCESLENTLGESQKNCVENENLSDDLAEEKVESVLRSKRPKRKKKNDPLFEEKVNDFIRDRKLESGKPAACKYCKKEYTTFAWLFKHEQEHEEKEDLPFKCSCCKRCFLTKEDVKTHQQQAHFDVLACRDCGDKMFANVDSLRSHKHFFHKGVPKKEYIYICEKCGRKFKQKSVLQVHNETDCGKSPVFQCAVCLKEFSSEHTRKAHMRVHVSEKDFTCRFCGKGFHWKGQLKVHERSHTQEKPYTCLFCPSAFAYRDSLITHSTLHTGIKPYFCRGCGWRFSCVGNLSKHKITHASTCGAWYQKNEKDESV